ncbi:uncharacterized protein LOC126826657 isoform X2 [Patella vulgata]|uniref:uncharacterized protein LOC126826657 isoform X2 n=1 Tax=Patella vulgata TaxID=6465 RepID=UPI0021808748|nr:uncharacterized protein LOC126826657 isoform X2 [Patella vulgata]
MNLKARQILIFILGWLAYASTYLLRKPLGVIKADLEVSLSISKTELGWLDTALLLPYALMQMCLGQVGDRIGARLTLGMSLILAGLSMISFGYWNTTPVLGLLLFINGSAQSQCWPNCSKILLSWFADRVRNSVFGMFGTCAFGGGIIGTFLAVILQTNYGWRAVYVPPSLIAIFLGTLVLIFYRQSSEAGVDIPGRVSASQAKIDTRSSSLYEIWKIPMVAEVAISVFCLKVVRYCMYMWLPLYLLRQLNYSKSLSGIFSTVFDIGGVAGSALIGILIDRFYAGRSIFGNAVSVALSTIFLICFNLTCTWGMTFNAVFMFLAGAFSSGPDTLLGGSIAAELGEKGNRNAAVATVGLINGFGSVGTFMEGPIIGFISTYYGWSGMFYFMIILSIIGTISCFKAAKIHKKESIKSTNNETV